MSLGMGHSATSVQAAMASSSAGTGFSLGWAGAGGCAVMGSMLPRAGCARIRPPPRFGPTPGDVPQPRQHAEGYSAGGGAGRQGIGVAVREIAG